jgi:uncharacterized coiled-coil DUF342 family protein
LAANADKQLDGINERITTFRKTYSRNAIKIAKVIHKSTSDSPEMLEMKRILEKYKKKVISVEEFITQIGLVLH